MLSDRELQSLRNLGNEAEAAADEIVGLRARMFDAAIEIALLRLENETLNNRLGYCDEVKGE